MSEMFTGFTHFVGTHPHTLDAKGRVILPAEYREHFASGAVLTKLIDGCLALWPTSEFERVAHDMMEKARRGRAERKVARAFSAGAKRLELDKQGRFAIPQLLRDYASLDKEVMITGSFNRVEIWDRDRWLTEENDGEELLREASTEISDLSL